MSSSNGAKPTGKITDGIPAAEAQASREALHALIGQGMQSQEPGKAGPAQIPLPGASMAFMVSAAAVVDGLYHLTTVIQRALSNDGQRD